MNPSQETLDKSSELQPSWEIKEAQILEGLDKKVKILAAFSDQLDLCTLSESPNHVKQRLNRFFSVTLQQYPQQVINDFQRYEAIEVERKNRSVGILDSVNVLDVNNDMDFGVEDEQDRLLENQDIAFLIAMRQITDSLIAKNRQVHRISKNPKILDPDLAKIEKRGFKLKGAENVQYGPFSATFIINQDNLPGRLVDYAGLHFVGTPINLVVERGKRMERTILHEEVHNRIDGVKALRFVDPSDVIKRIFDRYKKANQAGLPMFGKRELMGLKPGPLINCLHDEILAHIQIVEANNFQADYQDIAEVEGLNEEIVKMGFNGVTVLNKYTRTFATAGAELLSLSRLLDQEGKTVKDSEIQESLRFLNRTTTEMFIHVVENMGESLGIAERIGEDAHLATHLLFYVLKPTQYHHINRFLRLKYGDTVVENALQSKKIGDSFSFYPTGLEEFTIRIEKMGNSLTEIDKAKIEKQFIDFWVWYHDDLVIDLNSRQAYRVLLERVGKVLGINTDQYIPTILKGLTEATLFDTIKTDLKSNFSHLPNIYQNLTSEDQKFFADMLGLYITNDILDDLEDSQGRRLTPNDFKATPYWNIIKQLGLEEKIESMIQNMV
ncbi:hypothetical protein HY385_02890 [Candidatus Daviesbacteria bacterium]|nr:hypothetical protein [Candidatus Daviesbacteria bacterium]